MASRSPRALKRAYRRTNRSASFKDFVRSIVADPHHALNGEARVWLVKKEALGNHG